MLCLKMLIQTRLWQKNFYKVENLTIDDIANARNWIVSGGNPDIERTSVYILRDFREGKIGKFILDDFEG